MKLLLGDCIEVMGSLEANSIDASKKKNIK